MAPGAGSADDPAPSARFQTMVRIQVDSLQVSYDDTPALRGVTFQVERGEFVALVGPNGSGKSTVLRTITNLVKPRSGQVKVDGIPVARYRPDALARIVSVVRQEEPLDFEFTVEEIVTLGRIPHLRRFEREGPNDRRIIREALELTGLSELANRSVVEISGGERQRVGFARALAQAPEILLLDEPTAHLDLRYQIGMLDLLQDLCRKQGLTVVIVMHDLNLAAQYSRRMLLLDKGRLSRSGPPQQILTSEVIREVYGIEASITPHPIGGSPCVHPLSSPATPTRKAAR